MMKRFVVFLFGLILVGCPECPECPTCPGDGKAGEKPETTTEQEETTDAGVDAVAIGGEPKEVTSYELHGRAGFDKVNIFEKPDMDSPRLGYMRKGKRTRLGDPKYASESCPKGWFKLPEGGFVCQGRGMLVGAKPRYIPRVPPDPRVDELDPYKHGFIRRDFTPSYKRIPTEEEIWQPPTREIEPEEGETPEEIDEADAGPPETEVIPHDEEEVDGGVDYHKYTKRTYRSVRSLLSRGFWVSVGARRFDEATRKYYYETIKGEMVPGENVHLIKPPRFKGYEVLGDSPLPAAIVRAKHASFYTIRNGKYRGAGPVDRLSTYRVLEVAETKGATYYKIEGERWLKASQVEFFAQRELPEGVGDNDKWILVDLTRQTLEAYEGTMPVYVTLVSSGLPDNEETVTPTGRFHITFKHLTDDMAGTVGDEDAYSVEDVPWVQYLHRNIAFHASFWHSHYGRPKSHGCINLAPADARAIFDWTDPPMPEKWHGVAATENNNGTLVIIEGETPDV